MPAILITHEAFISELEATSNSITDQFLEYWSTNNNLEIQFEIQPVGNDKYLNIRIRNTKHRVTLPLKNRSKGFIWFFSFLVWFSKIERHENVIILLDEPGLNLHAEAQNDLLRYIDEMLAPKYQVIYTTHSPFMIDPAKLQIITGTAMQQIGFLKFFKIAVHCFVVKRSVLCFQVVRNRLGRERVANIVECIFHHPF